jgi:hypothetical protein
MPAGRRESGALFHVSPAASVFEGCLLYHFAAPSSTLQFL